MADPIADFLATRRGVAPREPLESDLEGTVFDAVDPIAAWRRERELNAPAPEPGMARKAVDAVFQPLSFIQKPLNAVRDYALDSALEEDNTALKYLKAFGGSLAGTVGDMASPAGIASFFTGAGALGKIGTVGRGLLGGEQLGQGAGTLKEGYEEGDWKKMAAGAGTAALGALTVAPDFMPRGGAPAEKPPNWKPQSTPVHRGAFRGPIGKQGERIGYERALGDGSQPAGPGGGPGGPEPPMWYDPAALLESRNPDPPTAWQQDGVFYDPQPALPPATSPRTTMVGDAAGNVRPNTQGAQELEAFLRGMGRLNTNERPLLPPQAGETGKGVPLPETPFPWMRENGTITPAQMREGMDLRGGDPLAEIEAMLGAEGLPDAGQMPFQPPQGPLTGRFYEPELPNVQNAQGPPEPPIQRPPAEPLSGAPRGPQPRTPGGAGGAAVENFTGDRALSPGELDAVRELDELFNRRLGPDGRLPGNGTFRPEGDSLPADPGLDAGRAPGELPAPGESRLDEGGSPGNGPDGGGLQPAAEAVDPRDPNGLLFRRRPPLENAPRLTPQVRREIEQMLDDMENIDYNDKQFNDAGNGRGGTLEVSGGAAGAPVYDDILGHAPLNPGKKGDIARKTGGSRARVIQSLRAILDGNDIPDNIAEGAVQVAERRAKGDWNGLARPMIPYRDGVDTRPWMKGSDLPDEIPDELARLIDQYAGDEDALAQLERIAQSGDPETLGNREQWRSMADALTPGSQPDELLAGGRFRDTSFEDQLRELERTLGASSIEEVPDGPVSINGSGDSAASGEALSRDRGMRDRGEQFVVYDRAGNKRPLIGPDAVDYVAKKGETYGIEGPDGFRPLDDQGGVVRPKPEPTVPGAGGVAVEEPAAAPRDPNDFTDIIKALRSPDGDAMRARLLQKIGRGPNNPTSSAYQIARFLEQSKSSKFHAAAREVAAELSAGADAPDVSAVELPPQRSKITPASPIDELEQTLTPTAGAQPDITRPLQGKDGLRYTQIRDELMNVPEAEGLAALSPEQLDRAEQVARFILADESGYVVPNTRGTAEQLLTEIDALRKGASPVDELADVLDTGELQPRLPEAGQVREQNVSTPEFEAPFSLDGGADTTRREVQRGIFDEPAPAPDAPPDSPDNLTDLEQILTRHEVRNPGKADEIAQSMERVGWKGRPVLVLNDGGKRTAWTATHRLEAAKRAGLKPSDVPMVEIDADALRLAGHDVAELTGKGKNARIKALRDAGLDDAADLLEQEKAASDARNSAAAEGVPESKAGIPPNVRDFLTRQLKYTREQVDAMAPDEARRIGRERVMNPEPAAPVEDTSPSPQPLPERKTLPGSRALENFDQLRGARGKQRNAAIERTRVPNEQAEFGVTKTPVKSPQERHAAGEKLTTRERTMLGLPEETRERGRVSLRDQGNSPRQIERRVVRMQKWIGEPTPENFAKWVEEATGQAERWNEKVLKGGTGEEAPPKRDADTGEYLASGIFPGAQIFSDPKILKKLATFLTDADPDMRILRAVMGGAIGAWSNDDNRLRGMIEGALLGAYAGPIARGVAADFVAMAKGARPKHLAEVYLKRGDRDLSLWERYMSPPPSAIREYYKAVEPGIGAWKKVLATGKIDTKTPLFSERIPNKNPKTGKPIVDQAGFLAPERKWLRDQAKEARAAGKTRLASYLDSFHDDLAGAMTVAERGLRDNFGLSPKRANYYANEVANQIYRTGLAFNAASAIVNRISQPLLAAPYVGLKNLWKAYAPLTESEKLMPHIVRPVDAEEMRVAASRTLAKFDELASWMMRFTDDQNRQGVAAAAHRAARQAGAPEKVAIQFAQDVAEKTQGLMGIGTSNPSWRGPIMKMFKPFTKFPILLAEWANDIAVHPDPRIRLRTAAMLGGVYALSRATGVDAWDMLAGGARWGGSAIIRAAMDSYAHLTNNSPDHAFFAMPGSGFLDSDAGNVAYPVGIRKTVDTARRFYDYGLDTHKKRTPGGSLEEVSALEDAANYFGVKTTRQTDRQAVLNEAFEKEKAAQNADMQESAQVKRDYYTAHDRGDEEAANAALEKMGRNTRRSVIRGQDRDRFQRLYHDTPVKRREQFIDNYGELEKELGLK